MAASKAVEVDAAGEAVRVTSPDRVIYPATDATPEVTKLQVVEYYVSVADGVLRALGDRPTALERWTTGVHPGITLATGRGDKSDAFYSKRVPKGAPSYVETTEVTFPSGRTAEEVKVANLATIGWCAQMGTHHLPPVADPQRRQRPPRRAAHRPRPAAGHHLHRRRPRRRRGS